MWLKYSWINVSSGNEMNPDELLKYLLHQQKGIVLLDGCSGCGKTTLLKKLREASSRPVYIFSYESVVDEILRAARAKETCERYLLDISENNCVIGIEDVDYLRGKEATQACLAEIVCNAAEKHLIIMTGNDIRVRTLILCQLCAPEVFTVPPLREVERMCLDLNFDRARAEKLLTQIDLNQEFQDLEYGMKTVLLDFAATWSNVSMVELLLKHGADPNLIFDEGKGCVLWLLQYANDDPEENQRRLEIVKMLLENGADPHLKVDGEEILRWATFCHIELDQGEQWDYREAFIRLLEQFE